MASSSKRGRINDALQAATCIVDGCNADLSNYREYHRRHKVCDPHSKTPQVSINGQSQRFCQQCSRFHSLEEFDEEKRSCRKRLDGHNRRRRKPQPDTPSHCPSIFSGHQGSSRMLEFSRPPVHPTMGLMEPLWTGMVNPHMAVVQSDCAPSLLSASMSPVMHSFSTTGNSLDLGLNYESDSDMGINGAPQTLPFYWE